MNKYKKRKNIRKQNHDYNQYGSYFVTICCKDHTHCFGTIKNHKMLKNELGNIALNCFLEIPEHHDNVEVNENEIIIMPNHIHGIIHLIDNDKTHSVGTKTSTSHSVGVAYMRPSNNTLINRDAYMRPLQPRTKEKLPLIIQQYKSSVTRIINRKHPKLNFSWQRSYHDRIIRNKNELAKIQKYIANNPETWEKDTYYKLNIN